MIKDPRNFLWIVPLVLLLAFPLWKPLAVGFLNPKRQKTVKSPPALSNPRVLSSAEMDGVQLEQSRNGAKEWFLTAGRLYSRENDSHMEMEDVQARFFGTGGKNEETDIRSQRANYNAGTRQLTLHGKVLVQNQQGYEMRTESLEYIGTARKIRTTSAVQMKGKKIEVSGKTLLYDIATGNYSLEGDVICKVW